MKPKPVLTLMLVLGLFAASGLLAGCFDSNKATNPIPVAETFDSGDLTNSGPTSIFVHTFNTLGTFNYRCRHHSGMTAAINVESAGQDSVTVTITDNVFGDPASPPSVKPGGYVKWVNTGSVHTVTRP